MQKIRIDRYKIKMKMDGKFDTFGDLAKAANISSTTMTKATNSYEWRASTLMALADALGCSPLDILHVDDVDPSVAARQSA